MEVFIRLISSSNAKFSRNCLLVSISRELNTVEWIHCLQGKICTLKQNNQHLFQLDVAEYLEYDRLAALILNISLYSFTGLLINKRNKADIQVRSFLRNKQIGWVEFYLKIFKATLSFLYKKSKLAPLFLKKKKGVRKLGF